MVSAPAWAQSPEATAAFNEGLAFKKAKDYAAALGAFQRAAQLDPKYAQAWAERGNSHLSLGQAKAATDSFDTALKLDPANQTARYNMAYALRQQKRFDEAAKQYQLYLQRSPDDADAHYGLAESLKAAGAHLAAAEAFEAYARTEKRATWKKWIAKAKQEAVALRAKAKAQPPTAPTVSTAPVVAAAAKTPKAKPPKATPAAAMTPAKKAPKLHLSFAEGHTSKDKAPEAVPATDVAAAAPAPAKGGHPQALQAGINQLKAGAFADALVRLKVAQAEAPDDAMVWAAVGSAHLGQLQGEQAAAAYRRALSNASEAAQPALHFGLGEALRVQGEDDAARKSYAAAADHGSVTPKIQSLAQTRLAAR